ncbi:MAG: mechanosensitive ion channel family protein [Acidimicrobiales bacterium]|jgi:small-conductance mechanosensitive channel
MKKRTLLRHRQKTIEVISRARQHDWKVALPAGLVAAAALVVGSALGNVHGPAIHPRVVVWSSAVVLLVFGVIATRRVSAGLGHLVTTRTITAAGAAVRLVTTAVGYLIIICAELGLLDVSIDHLLVGAGLAGVILGIAAQQSLGNVFASVVLLLAKPFSVGERIRIRSGALGGIFDATVMGVSLTYVTVRTDDGILKIPNSVMLATAAGPIAAPQEIAADQPAP